MKRNRIVFVSLLIILLIGCAAPKKPLEYEFKKYSLGPNLFSDPPRTVAVLPFSNTTETSKLTIENWKKVVDEKYFDLEEEQKKTEEYLKRMFVRRAFYKHFSVKPYRDRELVAVDQILKEKGMEWAEDLAAISPRELADLLNVDGLIYGEITHLSRIYLGLYSEVSVGCHLKFIDARTGEIIWTAKDVEKSRAGGASLSLTGLAKSILTASMNMRKVWVYRVADDLFRRTVGYMPDLEAAIEPRVVVSSDKAYLYQAPGFMGSSLGKKIAPVAAGSLLFILEEADEWFRVRTEDDVEGWIDPKHTMFSGKEIGRPFDIEAGLEDKDLPTGEELGGLFDLQGMDHFKEQKFDEALTAFEKAIEYDKSNAGAHFHLAWAYKMSSVPAGEKQDKIIVLLERAVELSPDNVAYYYNLGLAYNEAEREDEAVKTWQKCLELDPTMENVKTLLEFYAPESQEESGEPTAEENLEPEETAGPAQIIVPE